MELWNSYTYCIVCVNFSQLTLAALVSYDIEKILRQCDHIQYQVVDGCGNL